MQILPQEIEIALKESKRQYKVTRIKNVSDYSCDDGIVSFATEPQADETWANGGQILFCVNGEDGEFGVLESKDIQAFDPDTDKIFIDIPKVSFMQTDNQIFMLYKPFDFSKAVRDAYERLKDHPKVLTDVMKKVTGDVDPAEALPIQTPCAIDKQLKDVWDLPWSILWGPPGTGKTQSVVNACVAFALEDQSEKILVVTPTNNAADEVAYRICEILSQENKLNSESGCLVYRGGRGSGKRLGKAFPECLRDETYAEKYDALRLEIDGLRESHEAALFNKDYAKAVELNKRIKSKLSTLPDETMFALTDGTARVVVLTTYKAMALVRLGSKPSLVKKVIVDEAGMVSRLTTAAMASLGQSVLLAGDPKQIGPIFTQEPGTSAEVKKWLTASGLSHLGRVKDSLNLSYVAFLKHQYRMHPDISRVVSDFVYDGVLLDGDKAIQLKNEPPVSSRFPHPRATCLELDTFCNRPEDVCSSKPRGNQKGAQREFSAAIAVAYASEASKNGRSALILTPYRAQVSLIRKKLMVLEPGIRSRITVGTIHGQQGAERDLVILDTVKGAISWSDLEREMMLNVAVSRAKRHFILLASSQEFISPALDRLVTLLKRSGLTLPVMDETGQPIPLPASQGQLFIPPNRLYFMSGKAVLPTTLGDEIDGVVKTILVSRDQKKLIERNIGAGHYLVRGVAGSGKSLILAHWVVRTLLKNAGARILVTYYNKGIKNLIEHMLEEACRMNLFNNTRVKTQVTVAHIDSLSHDLQNFDSVFVDEAQDLSPEQLVKAFTLCREIVLEGRKLRNFILFHDDSQNIYGRKTIDEFRAELEKSADSDLNALAERLSFAGRSFVLRETYRSTQAILGFAINMALDPKQIYSEYDPGLLKFMRVPELLKEELLIAPDRTDHGLYEILYAERLGTSPFIIESQPEQMMRSMIREIRNLTEKERVSPGSIMVICSRLPVEIAKELNKAGISAIAYGGLDGENPINLPATKAEHVRCVTLHSCKGHEAPIVMFYNINDLHDLSWMRSSPKEMTEKSRHCLLYVGMTRAMLRLYVFGQPSALMNAAKEYAGLKSAIA
jgi:superfamily I DNA/RNA helicase